MMKGFFHEIFSSYRAGRVFGLFPPVSPGVIHIMLFQSIFDD